MILQCTVVDVGSDGLEKYGRVFISRFAVLCKLLRIGSSSEESLVLGDNLVCTYCNTFCQVLLVGLGVMGWHFVCQLGSSAV